MKSQTDTDFINKSKLYISTSTNNDEQKVVSRGALEFSSRSFKIEELIDDDDPLISLHIDSENSSDRVYENINRIEERFTTSSFLGKEPWLFVIDGKQTTAKRVHSIVPGQKYLFLQRQNIPPV